MSMLTERTVLTGHTEFLIPKKEAQLVPITHTQETLDLWIKWMNDPNIRKWMYDNLPSSEEAINTWLHDAARDPKRHYFSIQTDGKQIGLISLRQDQVPETTGEIGIVIGEKEYQNQGIGTQAVESIMQYAQDTLHMTSVRAMIRPHNHRSIRLFTREGFAHAGNVTIQGTPMERFEKQLIQNINL